MALIRPPPAFPVRYYNDVRTSSMASDRLQRRLERLLDEAEEAITELNWATVRDRANAVLAIDPGNVDGQAFLATAERALGGSSATLTDQPTPPTPTSSLAPPRMDGTRSF